MAHSRPLRKILHRAYSTRASGAAAPQFTKFDNSSVMQDILTLRLEEAQLLGYDNHADVSLVTKMAKSPFDVMKFLTDIADRARPHAQNDLAMMREFAASELNITSLEAWDYSYVFEKLKEARYSFSDQEVKQYFTAPRVLDGLFRTAEQLFEINISPDSAHVWNKDVTFYRIERDGALLGQFYLDTVARTGKQGGAWMNSMRARWLRPDTNTLQTPVAHLICNFADGVNGKPALLTHDDVITLFHEFGHGLHHLLCKVDEIDVSGISGVEWDAVEMPSQFMENFCWEWDIIQRMTSHVDTAAPLPRELFDRMLSAKNFMIGWDTMRQIEDSVLDMQLHTIWTPDSQVMDIMENVAAEFSFTPAVAYARPAHSFTHIFSGGYSAGYYSYKWAEVLSADAYAAFLEASSVLCVETGRKFRETILEVGGSRPIMESFVAFRGREPRIEALMIQSGMD
jgi:oligopeptidase A